MSELNILNELCAGSSEKVKKGEVPSLGWRQGKKKDLTSPKERVKRTKIWLPGIRGNGGRKRKIGPSGKETVSERKKSGFLKGGEAGCKEIKSVFLLL